MSDKVQSLIWYWKDSDEGIKDDSWVPGFDNYMVTKWRREYTAGGLVLGKKKEGVSFKLNEVCVCVCVCVSVMEIESQWN